MANKTNCIKNGIPYYRIRRTVGKKLNKDGIWVDDIKEFYGKNKSDAEAKYEDFKTKRSAGLSSEKQHFGVIADFFVYNVFLNDGRFTSTTKERYEQVYRKYVKQSRIAGMKLDEVKTLEMQEFYNTVDCSDSTLKAINNIMGHLYKYLEKEGYSRNITRSLVLPKKKQAKGAPHAGHDIVVWTDEELKRIIQNLADNRFRLLVLLAINTGCRISELLALKYMDISDKKVYITKQLSNVADITDSGVKTHRLSIEKTKTTTSVRNIPLSDNIIQEIEKHHQWHQKEMLRNGYRTEFIFTTQSGGFYDRHNIATALKRYYKRIGIDNKGFHTYRHTFCTNLCKKGVPLQTAYKLLGHSNINVTARFYVNIDDEQKREAIQKITTNIF
ncbi:site-specific integrase [Aminipila butyrica]|uniref:Site-specific integrase n=1 Tax=Aminipila butyrica TaxID=433296 RepID=A0A858BU01_9FIRM|nr:site-specific integrase [Aminipila butyrica]QIB68565.1 site-specific integrase [Aminipila butyrica]